jgi:hypothetical protein
MVISLGCSTGRSGDLPLPPAPRPTREGVSAEPLRSITLADALGCSDVPMSGFVLPSAHRARSSPWRKAAS